MKKTNVHAEVARLQEMRDRLEVCTARLVANHALDCSEIAELHRQVADINVQIRRLTGQADPKDYIV